MNNRVHVDETSNNDSFEDLLTCAINTNTLSEAPSNQFDLFRSWHQGVADTELLRQRSRSFPAHEMAWDLGKLTMMFLELPGKGYRYRWQHLKKPNIDHWYLFLPLSSPRAHGESWEGKNLTLQSFIDPFEYVTEDDACIAIFMPRDLHFIQSSKVEIREESKRFLSDYMLLLHRSLPDLRVSDVPHIVRATTSLIATSLSPSRDHFVRAERSIEAVIVERASRIITQKLNDRNLTPDTLCRDLGVSRSRLYRIFEFSGGVSNYIRRERLLKTRDILMDISDGRSISSIAEDWGFTDPSAYSRVFRKEFGITPKEARMAGWRGDQPAPLRKVGHLNNNEYALRDLLLGNYFEQQHYY